MKSFSAGLGIHDRSRSGLSCLYHRKDLGLDQPYHPVVVGIIFRAGLHHLRPSHQHERPQRHFEARAMPMPHAAENPLHIAVQMQRDPFLGSCRRFLRHMMPCLQNADEVS